MYKSLAQFARSCPALQRFEIRVLSDKPWSWVNMTKASIARLFGAVMEDDGVKLKMDRTLSVYMTSVLGNGFHEREERLLVLPELEESDRVMELGGGVGHLATRCALVIGSDRVTVFEANPALERVMRQNFALNNVSPTAHFCMLGRQEGEASFYTAKHFWASSALRQDTHRREVRVPVKAFNDVAATLKPSFLIVDIEGSEVELFQYAKIPFVRKLMVEFHPKSTSQEEIDLTYRRILAMGFIAKRKENNCYFFVRSVDGTPHAA